MGWNILTVLLMFGLVFSLAGNAAQFIMFYNVRSGLDDTLNELIRTRNELSASEDAIKRIHIMYQKELGKQRDMFCRYWADKKTDGAGDQDV